MTKQVVAESLSYLKWGDGTWRSYPPPVLTGGIYPGIPYPTDPVPSAIMPSVPNGADFTNHEWVNTYDPLTATPPPHSVIAPNWPSAEQANCYYIDKFHPNATDSNNPYGYPNRPRLTIPLGAWLESTKYIEIHGNNTPYENNPDYTLRGPGASVPVRLQGTKDAPVFVVGVNKPRLGNSGGGQENIDLRVKHTIFDGLIIQNIPNGRRPWPQLAIGAGTEYFCFRNGGIRGNGNASSGGQVIPINGNRSTPVRFVVVYNSYITDCGDWFENPQERDVHGFRPLWFCRYLWLLDCELARLQADGVQCGNSANAIPSGETDNHDARSHYVWIAGCDFYDMHENAIDNKNSFHIISSCNEIHGIYRVGTGGGANNTAYTISNNSEGPLSGWHWSLFDHIYDSGAGIRCSGDTAGQQNFVIGAIVEDIQSYAFRKENNGPQIGFYVVDSVAYKCGTVFSANQPGQGSTTEFHGLIAQDCANGLGNPVVQSGGGQGRLVNCRLYNAGSIHGGWQRTNVVTSTSSLLKDPDNGDFTPIGDALNQNSEHMAYQLYKDMYGIDIKVDRLGNERPADGPWDVGPIEAE